MKTKLLIEELSPTLQEYKLTFGHEPSIEAEKYLTQEELDSLAREALDKGSPIPEWRDRFKTKTGSTLDLLYRNRRS
jgi:hypothetical protein